MGIALSCHGEEGAKLEGKAFTIGSLLGASIWRLYGHFQLGGDHEADPEFPGGDI